MSLYQQPGLLTGLTRLGREHDAAGRSGRTTATAPTTPAPTPARPRPPFTFNPFDRASWWTDPKGSTVDTDRLRRPILHPLAALVSAIRAS